MLYVKWQEVLWGKGTQARETRQGAGGKDCLSGEATSEQRRTDSKGRHPDASIGGDASRKHGAPWWEPGWWRNAGISVGWARGTQMEIAATG